ncbi:phage tail protein [Paenibacillus cisolokensis]|uniref:phage tail protein n=1 Tax=Paenibacillus cisolokensis TaxID=1658519 RepID=UPI003D2C9D37
MIGTFGDVVFVASSNLLRTFQDFSRSTTARWAVHEIHLQQPKPEFLGPGQDSITFAMRFDVRYGVNPRNELTKLIRIARSGKAEKLVIGGVPMGAGRWYLESVDQEWTAFDGKGRLLTGGATVTLKEYV